MTNQHTPGPWKVFPSHKPGFLHVVHLDETGELTHTKHIAEIDPSDTHRADAELIAAAPAMRDLLVEAYKLIALFGTTATDDSDVLRRAVKWLDRSEEVIPCPTCGGTGSIDSGGFTPWGQSIDLPCPSCSGTIAKATP